MKKYHQSLMEFIENSLEPNPSPTINVDKETLPITLADKPIENINSNILSIVNDILDLKDYDLDLKSLGKIVKLPIDDDMKKLICFNENLIVSHDANVQVPQYLSNVSKTIGAPVLINYMNLTEVGGMCLNIEQRDKHLIVYKAAQFSFENYGAVSTILSVLGEHLNLIEEKRSETLCSETEKQERSLHTFVENNKFVAHRTEQFDKEIKKYRTEFQLPKNSPFILDGGGFLLMRYLILSHYVGDLETYAMNLEGELCRSIYKCGERKLYSINGNESHVIIIDRTILNSRRKLPQTSRSYFLTTGHLILHTWSDCQYILHINKYSPIPPYYNRLMNLHDRWQEDIQLFSLYLDEKHNRIIEIQSYINDNPLIKCMIKDYIACLLHLKPNNVLDFTMDYFINFDNKTEDQHEHCTK